MLLYIIIILLLIGGTVAWIWTLENKLYYLNNLLEMHLEEEEETKQPAVHGTVVLRGKQD